MFKCIQFKDSDLKCAAVTLETSCNTPINTLAHEFTRLPMFCSLALVALVFFFLLFYLQQQQCCILHWIGQFDMKEESNEESSARLCKHPQNLQQKACFNREHWKLALRYTLAHTWIFIYVKDAFYASKYSVFWNVDMFCTSGPLQSMSRYRVLKLWITVIIYNQYLVLKNTVFSDVQLYNVSKYNRWLSKLSLLQQLTSCAAMFPCVCKQATNTAAKMTLIMRTKTNINVISSKIQIINCFPQPLKDKRTHAHIEQLKFSV